MQYSELLSSNAGSTSELQQAIENCDFDKVISKSYLRGISDICPIILQIATDESVRFLHLVHLHS